ncbi:MAG: hypothetical protein WC511_02270 [Candidatus Pacearchaeota archaeon]
MKRLVIADKNKKDFNPAVPEPEFDPSKESKEAYTTVPTEIQALTPEQQHHITKTSAKLIGKDLKEAVTYLAGRTFFSKINNPDYKFYVLNADNTRIHSGWEFVEDAKDCKRDEPNTGKILQKKGLKALGIDPENDAVWANDKPLQKIAVNRITVKCTYEDGNTITTGFNGTLEEAKKYFEGQSFNFGDTDEHPQDKMVKCVKVEEISENDSEMDESVEEEEPSSSLKDQMLSFLQSQYEKFGDWKDDAEVAIYYFATDYHSGQSSELYSILSTSDYHPGPNSKLESEGDLATMMYSDLEEEFKNKV